MIEDDYPDKTTDFDASHPTNMNLLDTHEAEAKDSDDISALAGKTTLVRSLKKQLMKNPGYVNLLKKGMNR